METKRAAERHGCCGCCGAIGETSRPLAEALRPLAPSASPVAGPGVLGLDERLGGSPRLLFLCRVSNCFTAFRLCSCIPAEVRTGYLCPDVSRDLLCMPIRKDIVYDQFVMRVYREAPMYLAHRKQTSEKVRSGHVNMSISPCLRTRRRR